MTRNIAASVHQRLLNQARDQGRPFEELLQYFVLERFLYRLGQSPYVHQFVLKGALMFGVWQGPFTRPTRDVDLLGRMENRTEAVTQAIRTICQQPTPEDDGYALTASASSARRSQKGRSIGGCACAFSPIWVRRASACR